MKKGFTLIELLVVVLIIGILSAVALPQYQKAVEKARMAEAKTMLSAIAKEYRLYLLQNGQDADCDENFLENMNISIAQEVVNEDCPDPSTPCAHTKDWVYSADCDEFYAWRKQNGNTPYKLSWHDGDYGNDILCWVIDEDGACDIVCGGDGCSLN